MLNFYEAQYEASYGTSSQLPTSTLPEIAFSGRSNVGKSSLLNRLTGRKNLVKVSSTPGKTRTVNFFKTGSAYLTDLPGYGYAKISSSEKERWAELMESYFTTNRNITLVVQLIDMRHPPSALDIQMLNFIKNNGLNYIIVLTKSDKLNKTETQNRLNSFKNELEFLGEKVPLFPFSALKNIGTDEIKNAIRGYIE